MTDRYPDARDLEGLYNQADNQVVTDTMVMVDRQELADLRRQLAEAQEALQAAVELIRIREWQLRDELARAAKAETQLAEAQVRLEVGELDSQASSQNALSLGYKVLELMSQVAVAQARIRQQDIALDENRKMVQTAGQGQGRAEVEAAAMGEELTQLRDVWAAADALLRWDYGGGIDEHYQEMTPEAQRLVRALNAARKDGER